MNTGNGNNCYFDFNSGSLRLDNNLTTNINKFNKTKKSCKKSKFKKNNYENIWKLWKNLWKIYIITVLNHDSPDMCELYYMSLYIYLY